MESFVPLAVAATVFLTVLPLVMFVGMRTLATAPTANVSAEELPVGSLGTRLRSLVDRLFARVTKLTEPKGADERADVRSDLVQAGFLDRRAVPIYHGVRALLAVGLPFTAWAFWRPTEPILILLELVSSLTAGYYLPTFFVSWCRDRRQRSMRRAFPNMLDMLVSCLEAGLGIDMALRHVAGELVAAAPEIARELALVNTELAAGVPRMTALQHFHDRTDIEEVASLVNELAQAERYGSRIAPALRSHAQVTRTRRVLESERKAAEASPKLTVVMILFILPPLFIVVLGPTAVTLIARFAPTLETQ